MYYKYYEGFLDLLVGKAHLFIQSAQAPKLVHFSTKHNCLNPFAERFLLFFSTKDENKRNNKRMIWEEEMNDTRL